MAKKAGRNDRKAGAGRQGQASGCLAANGPFTCPGGVDKLQLLARCADAKRKTNLKRENTTPMHFNLQIASRRAAIATALWAHAALVLAHEEVCRYGAHESGAHAVVKSYDLSPGDRLYAPDRSADVTHIKIDVTPDFKQQTVSGTAKLRFKPIATPLSELKLNGVNLKVRAVRGSHPVRDYSTSDDHVVVVFENPIPAGEEAWVEIDYFAEPQMGLYFRTEKEGVPKEDVHCWTQGEPFEARHWIPCFDSPNERSSTELICHVPEDMTVVSNGVEQEDSGQVRDGLKSYHWLESKTHTPYLICFVAGKFAKIDGRSGDTPLAFYTQPSKAKHAQSAFADTADIMKFFNEEIGVPFPWEKYDQATIVDFMWGGMENTTLTTLTQRAMAEPASENIREARGLVAHELAHQWFGDFVTCKDWSQLWLNEGFATYYALLYEGHKFGRDALLYGLYEDLKDEILPALSDKRPIAYRRYKRPDEQFDFRAYPKGSWVLHMLRSQLGEKLYREAVRNYLTKHAQGEVESEDLREAFEAVSGKPLDRFFDQWVYHGGMPELTVKYEWLPKEKLAHVSVEQTQTVGDDVLLFHIPTKLRFVVDKQTIDYPIEIDEKSHDFYVSLPAEPQIVRFDPDYSVLAKTKFELSDKLLEAQLGNADDAIGRVLACEGLAKRKTKGAVKSLADALVNDQFFGVRQAAADALADIGTNEAVAALIAGLEQPDARVRERVVQALSKNVSPEAKQALLDVVAKQPNPAVAGTALVGLANYRGQATRAALRKSLEEKSFRNEKPAAAMLAIGELSDPTLAGDLMKAIRAREADVDARDLAAGMISLAKISRRGPRRNVAYEFLAGYISHPREPLRLAAITALGELRDPRARALLSPIAESRGNDRLSETARNALIALDNTAPEVPAQVSELRRELRELKASQAKLQKAMDELESKSKAKANPATPKESKAAEKD
jgi:aminopeptidase N